MALKALLCSGNDLLPQHRSVLRAIHTLIPPQKLHPLARWIFPYQAKMSAWSTRPRVSARGAFLPAAAMAGYGCVGHCWLLEAPVRLPTVGIVKIVYGSPAQKT
jgi:hypothetical protein